MPLDRDIPARFLRTAFEDSDYIAIAYRRLDDRARARAAGNELSVGVDENPAVATKERWHHRFVTAADARAERFLAWLRYLNAHGNDIYVAMNAFKPGCRQRTEANVHAIRHIYVEFDAGGEPALAALRARTDLPPPSYVVHSSKGKFQVLWNVRGFETVYAKRLLRTLAYSLGADTAVHDINRVLRLPGYYNYKYDPPQFVRLEMARDLSPHLPSAFPIPTAPEPHARQATQAPARPLPGTKKAISRSERDWAHVRGALANGQSWRSVFETLVAERQDKPNPRFYAALTVLNALASRGVADPPELVEELRAAKGTASAGADGA